MCQDAYWSRPAVDHLSELCLGLTPDLNTTGFDGNFTWYDGTPATYKNMCRCQWNQKVSQKKEGTGTAAEEHVHDCESWGPGGRQVERHLRLGYIRCWDMLEERDDTVLTSLLVLTHATKDD